MLRAPVLPKLTDQQEIISCRKRGSQGWPFEDKPTIRQARHFYGEGTHEIATKNFRGWQFLLLIKRSKPAGPRDYFRDMDSEEE